jgi:DNA-binding MltR family transcriptional regulator
MNNKKDDTPKKSVEEKRGELALKEFREFINEFKGESDRAAVILGAAKLDLMLNQILLKVLFPNASSQDDLFDQDRPLSSFAAKINLCHRLGIIDSECSRALHMIRKIRNDFAHEVSGCSLNTGSHRDRVKELAAPLGIYTIFEDAKRVFFGDESSYSADFRTALAIVSIQLEDILSCVEPIRLEVFPFIQPSWERLNLKNLLKKVKKNQS